MLGHWGESKQSEWAEALELKREQLRSQRDDFIEGIRQGQVALRDQLVSAEASLEADLVELKAMRQALADRMSELKRTGCDDLRATLEREVHHLRRAFIAAQRSTKAALRGWERLAGEYAQSLQLGAAA
jgi:hypothetical protein